MVGYFAYQELTVVTDSFSVQVHIPAKRSDVFQLLLDPEVFKYQPLCVSVTDIIRSREEDGRKTSLFTYTEKVPLLPYFNISMTVSCQVNSTVIEENAVIRNRMDVWSGLLQVTEHWHVTDSKNGNGDETLLEDHWEFTTPRLFSRFIKKDAPPVHSTMMENIRQHFIEHRKRVMT
ncbi:hypothetical protein ACROYT_G010120 [Oculina patagonica]